MFFLFTHGGVSAGEAAYIDDSQHELKTWAAVTISK